MKSPKFKMLLQPSKSYLTFLCLTQREGHCFATSVFSLLVKEGKKDHELSQKNVKLILLFGGNVLFTTPTHTHTEKKLNISIFLHLSPFQITFWTCQGGLRPMVVNASELCLLWLTQRQALHCHRGWYFMRVVRITDSSRAFSQRMQSRLCLLRGFSTVSSSFLMGKEFVLGQI